MLRAKSPTSLFSSVGGFSTGTRAMLELQAFCPKVQNPTALRPVLIAIICAVRTAQTTESLCSAMCLAFYDLRGPSLAQQTKWDVDIYNGQWTRKWKLLVSVQAWGLRI